MIVPKKTEKFKKVKKKNYIEYEEKYQENIPMI